MNVEGSHGRQHLLKVLVELLGSCLGQQQWGQQHGEVSTFLILEWSRRRSGVVTFSPFPPRLALFWFLVVLLNNVRATRKVNRGKFGQAAEAAGQSFTHCCRSPVSPPALLPGSGRTVGFVQLTFRFGVWFCFPLPSACGGVTVHAMGHGDAGMQRRWEPTWCTSPAPRVCHLIKTANRWLRQTDVGEHQVTRR